MARLPEAPHASKLGSRRPRAPQGHGGPRDCPPLGYYLMRSSRRFKSRPPPRKLRACVHCASSCSCGQGIASNAVGQVYEFVLSICRNGVARCCHRGAYGNNRVAAKTHVWSAQGHYGVAATLRQSRNGFAPMSRTACNKVAPGPKRGRDWDTARSQQHRTMVRKSVEAGSQHGRRTVESRSPATGWPQGCIQRWTMIFDVDKTSLS